MKENEEAESFDFTVSSELRRKSFQVNHSLRLNKNRKYFAGLNHELDARPRTVVTRNNGGTEMPSLS